MRIENSLLKSQKMIERIGTDIVEIETIEKLIIHNKRFKSRVYTTKEIEYCEKKPNKFQHYAARFAAKEAVLKALGTGWDKKVQWKHIEIINEISGNPIVILFDKAKELMHKQELNNVRLSLSHSVKYAIAFIVIQ